MGWNEWNTFGRNSNDTLMRKVADALVASGGGRLPEPYAAIAAALQARERSLAHIASSRSPTAGSRVYAHPAP
jgi:hypothetical protein